jgi:alpha-ketoglutarate-dependent taurine dioxygenase
VPEVGMTDVYFGDLSHISEADLQHVDDVSRKHIVPLAMQPGDVVLVDNYRMLHGRDVFEGE